jgi:hypothetical protein
MPELGARRPDFEGIRSVYFALPGEEWRIDKYIAAIENQTGAWNDELERLQGSLLGYENWQNDWWIEHRRKTICGGSDRVMCPLQRCKFRPETSNDRFRDDPTAVPSARGSALP